MLARWHRAAASLLPPGTEVWDAHTHTGDQDPDRTEITATELLERLDAAGHAGAVVMTNRDPGGYPPANDRILAEAETSDGRLVPFLRVDPNVDDAIAEVERSLDAGHRGVKLHPRGESFRMRHATVERIAAIAAERGVPVLVHSGRGIPSMAEDVLALVDRVPGLRLILAHCAISDLSRLGPVAADHPGLFFDTSWWDVTDQLALFAWVPPSRILYASDTPYGLPVLLFTITMRAAVAAGTTPDLLPPVFGGTLRRLLAGTGTADLGPAPGDGFLAEDAGLLRLHASLHGAIERTFGGSDPAEPISLARAAADVAGQVRHAEVYRAIATTLDVVAATPPERRSRIALLLIAASAALTPGVPVPEMW